MNIDTAKASKWMTRERRWLKEYVARESQKPFAQQSREELAAYAAGTAQVGYASTALHYLANFHGASGCAAVLAGDRGGFAQVDLACLESYWQIRLLTRAYDLDARPDKQARLTMDTVATCWMHAEAIGAQSIRAWLDALVMKLDVGHGSVTGKSMNPLCTLMAHFVTGRDAAALERSGWAPIGIYAPAAARTLAAGDHDALAVFHHEGVDGDGYPPFHFYPYRVTPFELLAIAKRTGVPVEGRHPLCTSPLVQLRDVPEIAPTDELRAVVACGAAEVTA